MYGVVAPKCGCPLGVARRLFANDQTALLSPSTAPQKNPATPYIHMKSALGNPHDNQRQQIGELSPP